jgi:phage gp29-like protein
MAKKDKSQKQALETTQTSDVAWLTNQWQEHPVVGLTPARLHKLLLGAEQGSLQAQADLFADMEERDGHIFSEMDKRRKGVNGLPWGINPPKNATDQEKRLLKKLKNGLMKSKTLKCSYLMQWMRLVMAIAAKKSNGNV